MGDSVATPTRGCRCHVHVNIGPRLFRVILDQDKIAVEQTGRVGSRGDTYNPLGGQRVFSGERVIKL